MNGCSDNNWLGVATYNLQFFKEGFIEVDERMTYGINKIREKILGTVMGSNQKLETERGEKLEKG